jgi:hypothetical protein
MEKEPAIIASADEPITPEPIATPEEQTQQVVDEISEATDAESTPTEGEDTEDKVAESVGLDRESIAKEFTDNGGQITDETKAQLVEGVQKAFGFEDAERAEGLVNEFFEGKVAAAKVAEFEIMDTVGGRGRYDQIADWAKGSMTEEQLASHDRRLNAAAEANDMQGMKDVLGSLADKYESRHGTERRTITGDGRAAKPVKPITSSAELARLAATDEYRHDSDFRAQVERRLQAGMAGGSFKD